MGVIAGSWLVGFGLTLALELPFVFWLFRHVEPKWQRRLTAAFFANLSTHPLVWFVFAAVPVNYAARVSVSELWAVVIEGWFYATFIPAANLKLAFGVSLAANATSFGLGGLIIARFGHWLFQLP